MTVTGLTTPRPPLWTSVVREMMAPRDLSPHAVIVEEETFALVTELELRKAPRLGYPVSLLAVLPDVEGLRSDPGGLAAQLASAISPVLRATDLIRVSSTSTRLHVLLVDAPVEALPGVIQRIIEEVNAHLFRTDGDRTDLTLSIGGLGLPPMPRTAQELLSQASSLADEAHHDQPESHSYRLAPSA